MSAAMIWTTAALAYALFWFWYVGFQKKVTPDEVEATMRLFNNDEGWTVEQREHLPKFLLADDGRDFVMVNLLHLRSPKREARKNLATYQKIFLGAIEVCGRCGGAVRVIACIEDQDTIDRILDHLRRKEQHTHVRPLMVPPTGAPPGTLPLFAGIESKTTTLNQQGRH